MYIVQLDGHVEGFVCSGEMLAGRRVAEQNAVATSAEQRHQ